MVRVSVYDAKTHLSRLLAQVEAVIFCRNGKPVAVLNRQVPPGRVLGQDRGRFTVPDDFDAPLPDELIEAFEGR